MKHHPSACCLSRAQAEKLGVSPLVKGASVCYLKVDSLEEESTNSVINTNAQKMVSSKSLKRREGCALASEVPAFMAYHWLRSAYVLTSDPSSPS